MEGAAGRSGEDEEGAEAESAAAAIASVSPAAWRAVRSRPGERSGTTRGRGGGLEPWISGVRAVSWQKWFVFPVRAHKCREFGWIVWFGLKV